MHRGLAIRIKRPGLYAACLTLSLLLLGAPKALAIEEDFPAFQSASLPVQSVPNWGAMTSPNEWNKTFEEMPTSLFVDMPTYTLRQLSIPLQKVLSNRFQNIDTLTAKLTYSTRFFGAYHLDSSEFESIHPGVDIKLAHGTPIQAIGGGRVHAVRYDKDLGYHILIEHRIDGETLYSIYAHLDTLFVKTGDAIQSGETIGTVGMTGNTSAPHLHLQIDRSTGSSKHEVYWPDHLPVKEEAEKWTVHPMRFIDTYRTS